MIKVTYPPGAGGAWLLNAIKTLISGQPWQNRPFNFHGEGLTPGWIGHDMENSDRVLYIGSDRARYNFWRNYCYKSFLHEPVIKRQYLDLRFDQEPDRFFWVLNQCRYIQSMQFHGNFCIEWTDLWTNPGKAWNTIVDYLDHVEVTYQSSYDDFLPALRNYLDTCAPVSLKSNIHQKFYQIWCLAWLQNNGHEAPFNVFEQFGSDQMCCWISQYHRDIELYTLSTTFFHERLL